MIIWSGLGFLVVVITLGCALVCNVGFDAIYGQGYYVAHEWTIGVAMFLSAIGCWWLTTRLRQRPDRVMIDKTTGQEVVLRGHHTLFAIPVRFWSPILAVIGLVLCIMEFVK